MSLQFHDIAVLSRCVTSIMWTAGLISQLIHAKNFFYIYTLDEVASIKSRY